MLTPLTQDLIFQAASSTFEEAVFMYAEPGGDEVAFEGDVVEATMSFTGPRNGAVVLRVSQPFAEMMAATMLALEPGSAEVTEHSKEAVTELLNILAGVFVASWFGPQQTSRLGLPQLAVGQQTQRSTNAATMLVDGQRVEVDVKLEG